MTTREMLVYVLQETYAFHRDALSLLDRLHHEASDERVRRVLQTQRDGVRGEMETSERALNLLGARFTLEHSVLGRGVQEVGERFRHRLGPSRPQLEILALFAALDCAAIARSKYQAAAELARTLGEQDVVRLLEEMDYREVIGQGDLAGVLPLLLAESYGGEQRRAA